MRFATQSEFQTAIDLWFSNEVQARAVYGEIGTWDVSQITSMALVFNDRASFNADLSNWDTSQVTTMVR